MFVDVAHWTGVVAGWCPKPRRILEVGCGEGYSTARLVEAFPGIPLNAIDIAANIGRLYDGPVGAATFRIAYVEEIAAESPATYDLVVLSDVLHHVPSAQRESLLRAIHAVLEPGGMLAIKDWHRAAAKPIHWAVYGSDRYLTGDRVQYLKREEAREMLSDVFGDDGIVAETSIRPWTNNFAFHIVRN
ncbi:MAG: class I SAM-dependent methyltransferase [Sphingobium sp.]